ncbi:hypothetical protein ONS95_006086 [Cadophora gregata]|uniref:uncharacterized protein n=1 Tax=Cadophora gregata TaxID=51156 RepID=UPI0026DDC071|nr:uncharacterized protein ONS95_006086 [Cadophora gregata]KAK0102467.1 hypothetical protein ONS95_006086 [Cadophora gregata]KAK0104095.1 hypothetical protein ONS96_005195 [Cadophora gregata f. sp. sojae]
MAAANGERKSIMQVLPVEILLIICDVMPQPSLCNFRRTCRSAASIGEKPLVGSLHVMFSYKSFQNLLNISHHVSLRRYVTSIFYEVRFLEEVMFTEFRSNVLEIEELGGRTPMDNEEIIANAWKSYKPLLDTQMHMKRTNYDFAVLAQALPRFPILRKIEMSSEYGCPSQTMAKAYEATMAIPGLMMDGGEISDDEETGTRSLGSLLLAAATLPTPLETLSAHRIHWSFFNDSPLDLHFGAFTYLRHIDLVLEPDYDDWSEQDVVKARHVQLGKALRSAKGLETLRLTFDDADTVPKAVLLQRLMNVPVVWERISEGMTWPCLHTLELTVVTTSEAGISDFLRRHSSTLKVIKWHNMWLAGSALGWNRIFRRMKKHMALKVVVFGGIWGGDSNSSTEPKLLKMEDEVGSRVAASIVRGRESRNKFKAVEGPVARLDSPLQPFADDAST